MTELDVEPGHEHGLALTVEVPEADALLFVSGARPGRPLVIILSGETPARIDRERDRAVLRGLLLRALQRLDDQERQ